MSTLSYSQQKRLLSLSTPLGDDVFLLTKLMGNEGLTQESLFTLDVLSENLALDDTTLLGQSVNMDIEQHDGSFRVFNGIVDRIQARGIVDKYLRRYTFHIVSPISLMKKTTDVRHFLDATLLSTIEHMLNKHKLNYTLNIQHPQRTDEFIVQYNETDYDFTHRLLQEAGINYRIEHKTGEQTLALFDSPGGYINSPAPEHEYRDGDIDRPHYFNWHKRTEFPTARTSQRSFDFLRPYTPVKSHTDTLLSAPLSAGFEEYTYPGLPVIETYADRDSERQMERMESEHDSLSVHSTVRSLGPGQRITFSGTHPFEDERGQRYIVTHTRYEGVDDTYLNQGGDTQDFQTNVTAIPDQRHYHPPLRYNRPSVEGSQTAIVTGPPGEEIYTDEHGRIKVQFHWDRLSKRNQDSSCWIRVMQSLAGDGWGTQFIPRIGDEVLVHFIDGDINKPVVTGGVYNGKNNTPYDLPKNKTQMGIKSRSSKGASQNHANELRFEDKKDNEDLFIQAQRDQTTLIKSNHSRTVGNDQNLSVGGNKSEVVNESRSTIISEGSDSLQVEKDLGVLSVNGYTILDGHDSIELRTGSASVVMDKSGNLTFNGTSIHIDGSAAVNINAGASATAPAPQIPTFDNIYTTPASVSAAVRMLPLSLAKPPGVDSIAKNGLSRAGNANDDNTPEIIPDNWVKLDYQYADGEGVAGAAYRVRNPAGAILASGVLDGGGKAFVALPIPETQVSAEYFDDPRDVALLVESTPTLTPTPPGWFDRMTNKLEQGWNSTVDGLEVAAEWTWGTIQGDFNEDASVDQIIANTLITMIPVVDQIGDIRDIVASLKALIWDKRYDEVMVWVGLLLILIGLIPTLGSAIKGIVKAILKEGSSLEFVVKVYNGVMKGNAVKYLKDLKNGKLNQYADDAAETAHEIFDALITKLDGLKKKIPESLQELHKKAEDTLETLHEVKKMINGKLQEAADYVSDRIGKILGKKNDDPLLLEYKPSKTDIKKQQVADQGEYAGTSNGDVERVDNLGPKTRIGTERELRVAEITNGKVAKQSRIKDGELITEDVPIIENGQVVGGIDVIGENGELIQVGGPGKNSSDKVWKKTERSLEALKREAERQGTKAKVYYEQGNSDRFRDLIKKSEEILGKENVFTLPN